MTQTTIECPTPSNTARVYFASHSLPRFSLERTMIDAFADAFAKNRYLTGPEIKVGMRVGEAAAEECFDMTNNPGRIAERAALGNYRSVSVGDVVKIGGDCWLCLPDGWQKLI